MATPVVARESAHEVEPMDRREFLRRCAAASGAAALVQHAGSYAAATPHLYARVVLTDVHGEPLRARSITAETNYVFQYPYAATPCFLLRLTNAPPAVATLRRQDGATYGWPGGVGPDKCIVAFSAICAHKLAYPARDVSFIRYQRDRSSTSSGNVIHCCADHSVYDPADGARVVAGPAPQPLAAIVLEYDAAKDTLAALGTVGAEQFDAFFQKYDYKLTLEYGNAARPRQTVERTTVVRELANYCRTTIQC